MPVTSARPDFSAWSMRAETLRGYPHEAVARTLGYPMALKSAEDVAEHLPCVIGSYNGRCLHSVPGNLSPNRFEKEQPRTPVKTAAGNCPAQGLRSIAWRHVCEVAYPSPVSSVI